MAESGDIIPSKQVDAEINSAVEDIQKRFMARVGDRIARGLSLHELSEELITQGLQLCEANYGYVLRPDESGAMLLEAVVLIEADGSMRHPEAALVQTTPDKVMQDVLVIVKRVQSMLDAFMQVHLNSIVYRGINEVVAGVRETNRQLLQVLEASFNAIATVDENLNITAFNPACERLFDIDTRTALGASLEAFVPHDVLDCIQQRAADYSYSGNSSESSPYTIDKARALKSDAPDIAVELTVFHLRCADHVYTTLIFDDISNRAISATQLQGALIQYRTLTQMAPVGILKLDKQWLCTYVNKMWCQLSRRDVQMSLQEGWVEGIHADDQAGMLTDMRKRLIKLEPYRGVIRLKSAEGKTVRASINATALLNRMNQLTGSLVVIMDITEQYDAEQRYKQIAHHDALTRLPNRTHFLDQLHHALISRRSDGIVCLLFIDLDGFKAVNDTMGHDAGDELLQQVALRLRQCVRDEDFVARLGGDEFTVTVTRFEHEDEASVIADSIVHAIKQPFLLLQQEEVYVSASIGIAMATGTNVDAVTNANSLIKQADIALYRAKLSGRSRFVSFTPELDQAQRDRSLLITSLRRAVDRQDFELFYQPQVLIDKNQLLGFEALLRWPQQSGDFISPGDFIDVLEETGLIGELGEWAIAQAETNVITEIRALGVQISLDDFGTGYSSLAYLSQLPVDHLKIDRSFISDIKRFPHAVTVVKSIIALSNTLGIRVIAEGVESESVIPLLANEGCEGYQGFHFSEALPAREMASKLEKLETVKLSHYANFTDLG